MQDLFQKRVQLVGVYIVEAHAIDEWPVGDPLKITQPKSTIERCGVARAFVQEYQLRTPMIVDGIENEFSEEFAGWPVRFYVVEKEPEGWVLKFKAQPDEKNTYDSVPKRLEGVLEEMLKGRESIY